MILLINPNIMPHKTHKLFIIFYNGDGNVLKTNFNKSEEEYNVYFRTYMKERFFGPYLDFVEKDYKEKIVIELDRVYFEDTKYSNCTRLQLTAELLYEVLQETNKSVYINIWNSQLKINKNKDEFEIYKELTDYILKNVSF